MDPNSGTPVHCESSGKLLTPLGLSFTDSNRGTVITALIVA